MKLLRRLIFGAPIVHKQKQATLEQVCIPITAFPVAGGMRSVLSGVAQVMSDQWQITYLTYCKGKDTQGLTIKTFGSAKTHPWHFPNVWFYSFAGAVKLLSLLRQNAHYDLILSQDGVFTGAFAALIGKLAGVRVVCMDHGNMTWLENPALRAERARMTQTLPWPEKLLSRVRYACYWASLSLLAAIATKCSDQFLVAGDEVEEVYRNRFGVQANRIFRYSYMVDTSRFNLLDEDAKAKIRAEQELTNDHIIITMINRLAPEKGLEIALNGIASALSELPSAIRTRVRVIIAGDGPMRSQIEDYILHNGLEGIYMLWGEATPSDVIKLLAITDIFLYAGTRGTNYSVAILEAMAAACAIIASTVPLSNARLLDQGRGIAVKPGDATAISKALICLCSDLGLCREMGQRARAYVTNHHNAEVLKRSILRATSFITTIEKPIFMF
jgi:glycosyltransferase involved in cell wall biosynthesis